MLSMPGSLKCQNWRVAFANHRLGIGFVVSARTAWSRAVTAGTTPAFAMLVPLDASRPPPA